LDKYFEQNNFFFLKKSKKEKLEILKKELSPKIVDSYIFENIKKSVKL
jgi:hypothetical protein